jgi:micrococcal nuclease
MRRAVATLGAAVALTAAPSAAASVVLVTVTSPARPGTTAQLVAKVSPAATCSIVVDYKSGPSHAQGLTPERSTGGIVSWSWIVGTRTTPGRWGIVVSCGAAGTLRTSFAVA